MSSLNIIKKNLSCWNWHISVNEKESMIFMQYSSVI